MSPILKRDINEHVRQARRLAAVITGDPLPPHQNQNQNQNGDDNAPGDDAHSYPPARAKPSPSRSRSYSSVVSARLIQDSADNPPFPPPHLSDSQRLKGKYKASEEDLGRTWDAGMGSYVSTLNGRARNTDEEADGEGEGQGDDDPYIAQGAESMVPLNPDPSAGARPAPRGLGISLGAEPTGKSALGASSGVGRDLLSLLGESFASLLVSLVGFVFTGELLEHLAHWTVFRRVDELFILVPTIGNLNGNIVMCMSARLGTSANIGELDRRQTRHALLVANLVLLGLQALLISALAAAMSFLLGLATVHRVGDAPGSSGVVGAIVNATLAAAGSDDVDPGLAVGEQDFREGYTRPGVQQLMMVLATGMGAAGSSATLLGAFMSSLVVVSRWIGLDPDNITPPVAACGGDLVTLYILALLGSALVGTMGTPIPLIAVSAMVVAAVWFTRTVMRNEWVKNVAKGGWLPLTGAMLISQGTGMVLDRGVGKYRGFALLAISMTGLTGAIGAIHANRLSTSLHTHLHPHHAPSAALSPAQSAAALFALGFPCLAVFLGFIGWAGWIDLSLGWTGWAAFAITTAISIAMAHFLTLFFWSKDLDPEMSRMGAALMTSSYTLPIHSAAVDFIGQLLLMLAYEICIKQGGDVLVHDLAS